MIGLYRGKSLISRAIQWRTWSVYSHAAWIDPANESVYEAWFPEGVRHVSDIHTGHTPGTTVDIYNVEGLTQDHMAAVRRWLTTQLGKPYDRWAILGFLVRRDLADESAWVCSELVYQAFAYAGLPLLAPGTKADRVSPGVLSLSPLLRWQCTKVVGQRTGDRV